MTMSEEEAQIRVGIHVPSKSDDEVSWYVYIPCPLLILQPASVFNNAQSINYRLLHGGI